MTRLTFRRQTLLPLKTQITTTISATTETLVIHAVLGLHIATITSTQHHHSLIYSLESHPLGPCSSTATRSCARYSPALGGEAILTSPMLTTCYLYLT